MMGHISSTCGATTCMRHLEVCVLFSQIVQVHVHVLDSSAIKFPWFISFTYHTNKFIWTAVMKLWRQKKCAYLCVVPTKTMTSWKRVLIYVYSNWSYDVMKTFAYLCAFQSKIWCHENVCVFSVPNQRTFIWFAKCKNKDYVQQTTALIGSF